MLLLSSSKTILACVLFSLPTLLTAQNGNIAAPHFVVIGVIQNSNSANLIKAFNQYLSQHSSYPLHVSFASHYTKLLAYNVRPSHYGYLSPKYSLYKQGINMDDTLS